MNSTTNVNAHQNNIIVLVKEFKLSISNIIELRLNHQYISFVYPNFNINSTIVLATTYPCELIFSYLPLSFKDREQSVGYKCRTKFIMTDS